MNARIRFGAIASALMGVLVLGCGPAEEQPAPEEAGAAQATSAE